MPSSLLDDELDLGLVSENLLQPRDAEGGWAAEGYTLGQTLHIKVFWEGLEQGEGHFHGLFQAKRLT